MAEQPSERGTNTTAWIPTPNHATRTPRTPSSEYAFQLPTSTPKPSQNQHPTAGNGDAIKRVGSVSKGLLPPSRWPRPPSAVKEIDGINCT